MQDDLRALEHRWTLAVESARFAVWDLDVVAQLVHYPPQFKAMLGYPATEAPDPTTTWRDRVHPDDLAPMLAALTGHAAGGSESYTMEFRIRDAAGGYRWVLSRGRVVERDAAGAATRMIGTLSDLTDRKEAEELRLARDRAEAASLAKSEFVARMTHELRTPLNAVLGFAQLLSHTIGQSDLATQRRCAAGIEDAGWQLLGMIDNVLDFSRIERGQLELRPRRMPLAREVRAACDAAAEPARRRGVTLAIGDLDPRATVDADPDRVRQVVRTLLANAIQYNRPAGHVTVTLAAAGADWQVSVADTGPGIPAAQRPHLFEPFNRLGREMSAESGAGIGLALARWLVEAMGGRLALAEDADEGAVFTMTLPRVDDDAA